VLSREGYVMNKACFKTCIIGIFAILTLAPSIACAKDYCLASGDGFKLVGQRFTIPKKGQCTRWTGFTRLSTGTAPSVGTGCTASNGLKLSFTITTVENETVTIAKVLDSITLSLPSQTGSDSRTLLGFSPAPVVVPIVGSVCPQNSFPGLLGGGQERSGNDTKTP
jgi:hypothetical protein